MMRIFMIILLGFATGLIGSIIVDIVKDFTWMERLISIPVGILGMITMSIVDGLVKKYIFKEKKDLKGEDSIEKDI